MDPILERYQALEEKVLAYAPNIDTKKLYNAFTYADRMHSKQMRRDGTPYITHPLAVADIVADLKLDIDSLCAALLHDCIEDTGATHEDIARLFGEPVAELVEGVTKLTQIKYVTLEDKQMENLRKMLMAMSKDIRVVMVKLCDRLHNMRTMQYQTPKKQREKSRETLEIYAPIAHRLGMSRIKGELEDSSIRYLDPIGCKEIEDQMATRHSRHQEFLNTTQARIRTRMEQSDIPCTITSRGKHLYSIYRKMYMQEREKTLDEIFDLYALRIIVDNVQDCYNALGCVHDMFKPVPGRFKDYISTPKANGYRSLHTTVIGREGIPFEIQIRTWQMHEVAEYGVAAHWKYKQGSTGVRQDDGQAYEWVRRLIESQETTDAEEFINSLKVDLFSDEVFVFTPQGEVKGLPARSTPIDFAYSVHSAVGNSMVGAKVNGRLVPYETQLQNGDIVEIMTSKNAKGPGRDWMKLCKSNEARNKIRQWFKKERREENIIHGRSAFESELKHQGFSLAQISSQENLPRILKKVQYNSLDDMYAAIGYGGMTALKAINRIKSEMNAILKEQKDKEAALLAARQEEEKRLQEMHVRTNLPAKQPQKKRTAKSGVVVEGVDNCMVKFAKCCTPVPGDPIVGFVTKGFGVSIHRCDCPNAREENRKPEDAHRWLTVSWDNSSSELFQSTLRIFAKDRDKLFLDIAATLSEAKVRTDSLSAKGAPDGFANVTAIISVRDKYDLESVIRRVRTVADVLSVSRSK